MNKDTNIWGILAGIGAGAAAVYYFDPQRGARRRALVSNKVTSVLNQIPDAVDVTGKDLANRAYGFYAEAKNAFTGGEASDQVIEARVRSEMGRVVSHPGAINVRSQNGNVTLSGLILTHEVPTLLGCVESVRGVESITNNLEAHDSPGDIPALQGGSPREDRWEFMQENWSPAARFVAGIAGGVALAYALTSREALTGIPLGAVGAAILARSVTNTSMERLIGVGGGREAVTIQNNITVDTPLDVVYALWANFENFPKFMSNVLEVRNAGEGRSHWKVTGPAGVPVEWDAKLTKAVPNEIIAWKSVEGSEIPNAGIIHFQKIDDGKTQVNIKFSYNPPAGGIGHAVATIFGADPKTQMDQDLMRMKSFLESGNVPSDAAEDLDENNKVRSAYH